MASVSFEDAVAQIKDRLDVLDVVSKDVILKKTAAITGDYARFHKEKTPSFSVNPAKVFINASAAAEGGDALSYLLKTRGITFKELITELANDIGIELPTTYSGAKNKDVREQMIKACSKAAEVLSGVAFHFFGRQKSFRILKRTRNDEKIIKRYVLGAASNEPSKLL